MSASGIRSPVRAWFSSLDAVVFRRDAAVRQVHSRYFC
jgi:hypothetical protein